MRSVDDFISEIIKTKKKLEKNDGTYGGNVIPVLEIYKELSTYEERKAFQDALEKMLCDKNEIVRNYAVDICIGFFVFRDAI